MGLLARLLGRDENAVRDGERLYMAVLSQSRKPDFYGPGRAPDSYDGRIDLLSLHMALIIRRLRALGTQGERLSQAVFDAMVDDFDIVLREEGLTDKGVSKRIKPIVQLFYDRVKAYDTAYDLGEVNGFLPAFKSGPLSDIGTEFGGDLAAYALANWQRLQSAELSELAQAKFNFAKFREK